MSTKEYPKFYPPEALLGRRPREYTLREARQYFEFVMNSMDERIHILLDYFSVDPVSMRRPRELLLHLGKEVAKLLPMPEFSYMKSTEGDKFAIPHQTHKPELLDCGYSVALDMGLLTAKLLEQELGEPLQWVLWRKGGTRYVNYNRPVVVGFQEGWRQYDPLNVSVSVAGSLLIGRSGPDTWLKDFDGVLADLKQARDQRRLTQKE